MTWYPIILHVSVSWTMTFLQCVWINISGSWWETNPAATSTPCPASGLLVTVSEDQRKRPWKHNLEGEWFHSPHLTFDKKEQTEIASQHIQTIQSGLYSFIYLHPWCEQIHLFDGEESNEKRTTACWIRLIPEKQSHEDDTWPISTAAAFVQFSLTWWNNCRIPSCISLTANTCMRSGEERDRSIHSVLLIIFCVKKQKQNVSVNATHFKLKSTAIFYSLFWMCVWVSLPLISY